MTGVPFYNQMSEADWMKVIQNAHQAMASGTLDRQTRSMALQAIQTATNALNSYDQDRIDSTKLSSIPEETAAIGQGVGQGAKGLFTGVGQIAGDIYHGNLPKAGMDVVKGIAGTGKNIAGIVDAATDPNMPEQERLDRIRGASSTLPGLSLGLKPVQSVIGRLTNALNGRTATVAGTAAEGIPPIDPNIVDLGGKGGSPPPEPTPTGPIDLPKGGPTVPGYTPTGPATASPVPMESALEQLAKGLSGANRPPGFTPTEPPTPSPTEGAAQPGPASPFGSTPTPIDVPRSPTNMDYQPKGLELNGAAPPPRPVPPGGYPPTLAEMHGFQTGSGSTAAPQGVSNPAVPNAPGFFDEGALPAKPMRFIGPQEPASGINAFLDQIAQASEKGYPSLRSGEAGFMAPAMLRLMTGMPAVRAVMNKLGITEAQIAKTPSLMNRVMMEVKAMGGAGIGSMGQIQPDSSSGIGASAY